MKKMLIVWVVISAAITAYADNFDTFIEQIKQTSCVDFKYVNIIESDIFETVDSVFGRAYIAADGRYNINIGNESYLADFLYYYTYVPENNQVLIEKRDSTVYDEISFILNLDDLYQSKKESQNRFLLIKKDNVQGDYPDSLWTEFDANGKLLKQIEFYDVNEELNRIIFLKQEYLKDCENIQFEPDYPDSVERVKL